MKLDPFPRFPADPGYLVRKLTDLFRDIAVAVNGLADWRTGLESAQTASRIVVTDSSGKLGTDADLGFDGDNIVLAKTSGKGIKLQPDVPTFGWHDLLGSISIRGVGATDPSYNVYRGGIRGYQFDANEEVFVEFHVPHDYVPGSALYIHAHWSINGKTTAGVTAGTVNGGNVVWGYEVTYSKGHNQDAFIAPITTTTTSATATSTLYRHHIDEVQLSASSPSASQLDSDNIEVDGLILVRCYLSANNITVASGAVPAPFLHYVDIHYQSTGIGTKEKSPDFYATPVASSGALASLAITGHAPTAVATAHVWVTTGAGALTLSGYAPLQISGEPGLGELSLAGLAPTAAATANSWSTPGVGEIAITGQGPAAT